MKGIILLNGEPYSGEIDDNNAIVYCCDGAYLWAHGKVRIDKNVGDFDSLNITPEPPPEEIYPSEKNFTDAEIAFYKLLARGVDEIEIYGGGGKREDHFLGNLHLLYLALRRRVKCTIITDGAYIFAASGVISLSGFVGKTFSVLPFGGPLHIMDFEGVKYAYPEWLVYGECRGISNVVESLGAMLRVDGAALIIVNRGDV